MPLQIESWPLERLIPHARNARMHSDEQIAQIAASIREFGFNNPVLVSPAGDIIAGHGRILAARKLGLTEVPVITLGHLTLTQRRAFMLADNKLALNAGWDDELLTLELTELGEQIDLGLTGFSSAEVDALLRAPSIDDEALDESNQLTETFQLLVTCADESEQTRLLQRLIEEGIECRALIS